MKGLYKDQYLPSHLCIVNKYYNEYTLNFTHYHACRELRSGGTYGTFSNIAKDILQELQNTPPNVFAILIYLVNCSGLDIQFDHEIQ